MTEEMLRNQLREKFTAISMREWCAVKGVHASHVSEFLRGKRGPAADLLAALNLRIDFVKIRKARS